jgi:hypothetical protein
VIQAIQSDWSIGLGTFIVSMVLAVIGGIVIGEWVSEILEWRRIRVSRPSKKEMQKMFAMITRRDREMNDGDGDGMTATGRWPSEPELQNIPDPNRVRGPRGEPWN